MVSAFPSTHPVPQNDPVIDPLADPPLASRTRRAIAALIDGLAFGAINLLVPGLYAMYESVAKTKSWIHPWGTDSSLWPLMLVNTLLAILLTAFCENRWGRTLGKLFLGIKVVSVSSHELPDFGQTLLRASLNMGATQLPVVGQAIMWLDLLWMLFNEKRQSLHDKIARTIVIRESVNPDNPAKPWRTAGQLSTSGLIGMVTGGILLGLTLGVGAMLTAEAFKPDPPRMSLDAAVCQGGMDTKKCASAVKAYKNCRSGKRDNYGKSTCARALELYEECTTSRHHGEQACAVVAHDVLECTSQGLSDTTCASIGGLFLDCLELPAATPDTCYRSWNDVLIAMRSGKYSDALFDTPTGLPRARPTEKSEECSPSILANGCNPLGG